MTKLFIVGFPKDTSQIGLMELFSIHGIVDTVTMITDKDTGEPKGYAFITMNDAAGAARAIQALDGSKLGNRQLHVRPAGNKDQGHEGRRPDGGGQRTRPRIRPRYDQK